MKIFLGYDHRGVKLAYRLMEELLSGGHEVNEPFEQNTADDDYPDIAKAVCEKVVRTKGSCGILICGTGIGMCMAANKMDKIRAVLAHTEADAYFSRRHEDANVLVIAAGYDDGQKKVNTSAKAALEMTSAFLNTPFEGGRHVRRIKKMEALGKKA